MRLFVCMIVELFCCLLQKGELQRDVHELRCGLQRREQQARVVERYDVCQSASEYGFLWWVDGNDETGEGEEHAHPRVPPAPRVQAHQRKVGFSVKVSQYDVPRCNVAYGTDMHAHV